MAEGDRKLLLVRQELDAAQPSHHKVDELMHTIQVLESEVQTLKRPSFREESQELEQQNQFLFEENLELKERLATSGGEDYQLPSYEIQVIRSEVKKLERACQAIVNGDEISLNGFARSEIRR